MSVSTDIKCKDWLMITYNKTVILDIVLTKNLTKICIIYANLLKIYRDI